MHKTRHLEKKLKDISKISKIVLVLGARQVGKTTLLKSVFPTLPHIVFDAYTDSYNVKADPDLFLDQFTGPVIFDEVQYVPELLSAIKRRVDRSDQPGQYFLTGSQNFALLKNLAETMAGRVVILHLSPLTIFEAHDAPDAHWLPTLLEDPGLLPIRFQGVMKMPTLWSLLWRGLMPGLTDVPDDYVQEVLGSYVNTYIERDIVFLESIKESYAFRRFLSVMAALSAQEINASSLARDIEMSPSTVMRWKSVIESSFQWNSLQPFFGSTIKQLTKREKIHITDSGIASFLLKLSGPTSVGSYSGIGSLFESLVVQQVIGYKNVLPLAPTLYHWRSKGGAEVDLILERDGVLYPIEVKMRSYLNTRDASGIRAFRETFPHRTIAKGTLIYGGDRCFPLNEHAIALPYNAMVGL